MPSGLSALYLNPMAGGLELKVAIAELQIPRLNQSGLQIRTNEDEMDNRL